MKVLFLSNPNNPTGGVIPHDKLLNIIDKCNSVVVVDEAYVEFYGSTVINKIKKYSNLIILRTCSKAFGLAAIRLGFLIAGDFLINEIRKAKPPYNVNSITQIIGSLMLKNTDIVSKNIDAVKKEREYLASRLKNINGIEVYPAQSNFILIKCKDAKLIKDKLYKRGISIRNFDSSRLKDYLRITVSNRMENEYFLKNFMECRGDLNEKEC